MLLEAQLEKQTDNQGISEEMEQVHMQHFVFIRASSPAGSELPFYLNFSLEFLRHFFHKVVNLPLLCI